MSDQKKKPGLGTSRTIYFPAIGCVVLVSMLWEAISGYLAGGPDAPTVVQLIFSVVLFGGGAVFTAIQTYRTYKAEYAAYEKKMSAPVAKEDAPEQEEE